MKRAWLPTTTWLSAMIVIFSSVHAQAQTRQPRRRPNEVIAWADDGSVVVFAEPRRDVRRRLDLVARRVPGGEPIARVGIYPGQCARVIDGRVAIAHACAVSELRPQLPNRYRGLRYHIAATERGRITSITLRADGSTVEHQIPDLGLVLRGRTESEEGDRTVAVLEVARLDRSDESRVIDRRPVRPRARRRWTLLQAGEHHFIVVGRGVLRRIGRPEPARGATDAPQSDLARDHALHG